jgi:hypothetical protein
MNHLLRRCWNSCPILFSPDLLRPKSGARNRSINMSLKREPNTRHVVWSLRQMKMNESTSLMRRHRLLQPQIFLLMMTTLWMTFKTPNLMRATFLGLIMGWIMIGPMASLNQIVPTWKNTPSSTTLGSVPQLTTDPFLYLTQRSTFRRTAKDLPRLFWYTLRSILSNSILKTLCCCKIQTTPAGTFLLKAFQVWGKYLSSS